MDIKKIQQILDEGKNSKIATMSQHHISVTISNKENAKDPTFVEKRMNALKDYWSNEENIKTRAEQTKRNNLDKDFRKKRVAGIRKRCNKPVITPNGKFESAANFEKETGLFFYKQRRNYPHLFYYEVDGPGSPKYEKIFHSPYGKTKTKADMIELALQNNDEEIKSYSGDTVTRYQWWTKVCKKYPEKFYESKEIKSLDS